MKILLINGSPKGKGSNTYKLAGAFVEGIKAAAENVEVEELQVNRLDIKPCLGCFSCWNKTPGKCCIQDDMQAVIAKMLWADVTVWSFPLYFFNVPGGLKNLIDRQLPLVHPFMTEREDGVGNGSHASRYDMTGKRTVVISTCGFYTAEGNYDGVCSLFDHICGKNQYTAIFSGQGELFRVPALSQRTDGYLGHVRTAGMEYAKGSISESTREYLDELLYPKEIFESWADSSWGIDAKSGEKESDALIFTRQMAALYRKESYKGKEQVLEMYYTDLDECYQIVMGKEGSEVIADVSGNAATGAAASGTAAPRTGATGAAASEAAATGAVMPRTATTRIETPFDVWCSIAAGKIRGDEALMKQLYKVKGDLDLLIRWDDYFGSSGSGAGGTGNTPGAESGESGTGETAGGIHIPGKGTNMNIMLVPWMVFWIAVAVDSRIGSFASIGACALVPLLFYQNKKTLYDVLSGALVSGFSIAVLSGMPGRIIVPLSYLSFGIMWTATCFGKIPLTAHYSMNAYNGESALQNPLFMKTNWILTLMWGILYLLTPVWTYVLMGTQIRSYVGAVNSVMPIFMGIFTVWFQKWYPRKVARGK